MPQQHASNPWRRPLALVCALALAGAAAAESDAPQGLAALHPDAQRHLDSARGYLDAGRLRSAVIEAKTALQIDPAAADARVILARAHLRAGEGAAAEQELERALQLGASGVEPELAEALLQQGFWNELLDRFPEGGETDRSGDTDTRARLAALRADAWLAKGDRQAARASYDRALAIRPGHLRGMLGRARLAQAEGDVDTARHWSDRAVLDHPDAPEAWRALANLERVSGRPTAAELGYTKAIVLSPEDFDLRTERALLRAVQGDAEGAKEDLGHMDRVAPGHPSGDYVRGMLALADERYDEARQRFQRALGSQVFALPAQRFLGAARLALGEHAAAVDSLETYLASRPEDADARRLLARAYLGLGDRPQARVQVEQVLARDADDLQSLVLMSRILMESGQRGAANGYLRRVAALSPDDPVLATELAVSLLKGDDGAGGQEALELLEQTLEQDPGQLAASLALVSGLLQAGDYDKALETAERLGETYPRSAAPWTLAGIAHGAQGHLDAARAAFERALAIMPGEPSASANLAAIAEHQGRIDEARGYLEESLERFPDHTDTQVRLARLEAAHGDSERYRSLLEEAIQRSPESLQPFLLVAAGHLRAGDAAAGLAVLEEAHDLHGSDPRYLALRGALQLRAGDARGAVDTFTRRTELEPQSAEAFYQLANASAAAGDARGFEDALLRALSLDAGHEQAMDLVRHYLDDPRIERPLEARLVSLRAHLGVESPLLLRVEGARALARGDGAGAEEVFLRAMRLHPGEEPWVVGLARAQLAQGRGQQARKTLADWLAEHPESDRVRLVLADTYLGLGDDARALETFRQLSERFPDDPMVHNNLAWLMRGSDPETALTHARRAVELSGGREAAMLDTLGVVLIELGQYQEARQALGQAMELAGSDPSIAYHHALAMARAGDAESAKGVLMGLLARDVQFPERNQAQALFAEVAGR